MQKLSFTILAMLTCLVSFCQEPDEEEVQRKIDSIEKTFTYEHGTIPLKGGIGSIIVPEGFKYLNATQAERVLVDLWGNPGGADLTLGMLLPEDKGIMGGNGYVFNIQYDEIGYVKDDDANDIDYKDLLKDMQKDAIEVNKERVKEGYEPVQIVGWAATPFYDKDHKILHWAKEIKFGDDELNTLNYNIRVLGRKGVLILNAIATMPDLPVVQKDIDKVLTIVQFNDGYKYADFNSSTDNVAAWTIGGLVAGKVLAKVGFFAVLLKFWKIIAVAVVAAFSLVWKRIKRKRNSSIEEPPAPELPA